jgi:hypothetical protein
MQTLKELVAHTKRYLVRRQQAYRSCLPVEGQMTKIVLADLAKFCRANQSTFHPDPHVAARLDGRREVWLRISQHLNLSTDDLYDVLGGTKE